ncbi:glucan 1,4-alpha-glucosidase [Saccharophagus degradans]|uniref:Glucan 1,4-alpha-glucosidase n=1 Tax=Saccharophagus degradans TaxID=86304 RepID=A0AAW7X3N5_9GAMM|nr:glucan 1,4-alpha-glucosidase [Saccharophagus degradans]MBU2983852.1 glucan 1,4-alpha-glucosidase [Saccharophagus degradans]MDO6422174.1 glucan 1,4-alpha-glucosidase [Saccharophagus degradans]MDO6607551.1 glucan 1,4-alpha-glucosidase [Saccharophagus degradans]
MRLQRLMTLCSVLALTGLAGCNNDTPQTSKTNQANAQTTAPGAPGAAPTWAYSGKTGIGTSYEQYVEGRYQASAPTGNVSKVWFSVTQGILTETMYGLIHEAQLKDMQFFIQGPDFLHSERDDTEHHIEYLHTDAKGNPLSLAYKLVNKDKQGRYQIEKHIATNPDNQSVVMKVIFTSNIDGITPHLVANPHIANTGINDKGWVEDNTLYASDGNSAMAIALKGSPIIGSAGFVGTSDLPTDLADGKVDWQYSSTGETTGNVSLAASLPEMAKGSAEWEIALGFGDSAANANKAAQTSLKTGFAKVLANYNGEGEAVGWEDYLASLPNLPAMAAQATDGGKLAYTSAMVLKAQEDKSHAGALIASLSNPWGDIVPAVESSTGYKAVWPRDFYQVAMAFLALGDNETPKVAFEYLKKVQAGPDIEGYEGAPGWFLQKTHVDGTLEWYAVQLDQTAMPIMLGWRLWQAGILSDAEAKHWYTIMLKPAAEFLADGGEISLGWNKRTITPPYTQQERWEEQEGHSPSTTAAVIAGLVTAAEFAKFAGDSEGATKYLAKADEYRSKLIPRTYTTQGNLNKAPSNGKYFLRVNLNEDPNDQGKLLERNGQIALNESDIIDPGFLELVRYGVTKATDEHITESLVEIDDPALPDFLKVKYTVNVNGKQAVGWRRYGGDGYGETTSTGEGYGHGGTMHPDQRGRIWPFFTGERGHYELALAKADNGVSDSELTNLRNIYVSSMETFANEGLMLPEQVWDGVGDNSTYNYPVGTGTNSATPLAWTHAEYLKLLRSLADKEVWDHYTPVAKRYKK